MEAATQPKTAKTSVPEAKHWIGTLNNYSEEDEAKFVALIRPLASYYVYGKEVGENGTPHLQFMVSFITKKRLTALKKILPRAHFEIKAQKSTFADASNYCKKGEQSHAQWTQLKHLGPDFGRNAQVTEWGTLPEEQTVCFVFVVNLRIPNFLPRLLQLVQQKKTGNTL